MMKPKVLFCTLSFSSLVFVHGQEIKNDIEIFTRNGRKKPLGRPFSTRIGERSLPFFDSRRTDIDITEQKEIISQTIDLKETAENPENRDLRETFDEVAFWENYLLSGQVNSLPPPKTSTPTHSPITPPTEAPNTTPIIVPTTSPTNVATPPPSFNPTISPQSPPTEAPTCKPIGTYEP